MRDDSDRLLTSSMAPAGSGSMALTTPGSPVGTEDGAGLANGVGSALGATVAVACGSSVGLGVTSGDGDASPTEGCGLGSAGGVEGEGSGVAGAWLAGAVSAGGAGGGRRGQDGGRCAGRGEQAEPEQGRQENAATSSPFGRDGAGSECRRTWSGTRVQSRHGGPLVGPSSLERQDR